MMQVTGNPGAVAAKIITSFRFEPFNANQTLVGIHPERSDFGARLDTEGLVKGLNALSGNSGLVIDCGRLKGIRSEVIWKLLSLNEEHEPGVPLVLIGLRDNIRESLATKGLLEPFRIAASIADLGGRELDSRAVQRSDELREVFRSKIKETVHRELTPKTDYSFLSSPDAAIKRPELTDITLVTGNGKYRTLNFIIDKLAEDNDQSIQLVAELRAIPVDQPLVVDLSNVVRLGSTAVGDLVALLKRFRQAGQQISFFGASGDVARDFHFGGLSHLLSNAA